MRAGPPRWARPAHLLAATGLVVAAALLRLPPLGPSSLWLDDAWQALVVKADGPGEVLLTALTSPGLAVLLAGWFGAVGFSSGAAQTWPYLFGLAAPAVLYLLAVGRGVRALAALAGAGLLVTSPVLVTYSTRVKPFTLDALLAVGLLGLAWAVVDAPERRGRWGRFAVGAAVATAISAAVVPYAAAGLLAGGVAAWRRRSPLGPAAVATAGYGAAALAVAAVVLPSVTPSLRSFWTDHYLHGVGEVPARLGSLVGWFTPLPLAAAAVLLAGSGMWLVARRVEMAVLVATPVATAVALAGLHLAPLGAGRTDAYLYPALALAAALGIDGLLEVAGRRPAQRGGAGWPAVRLRMLSSGAGRLLRRGAGRLLRRGAGRLLRRGADSGAGHGRRLLRRGAGSGAGHGRRFIGVGAAVGVLAWLGVSVGPPPPYPEEDLRPLVALLEQEVRPADRVLVYSAARWGYALYTGWPVDLVRDATLPTAFAPSFGDPRVVVLGPHRGRPEGYRAEVAAAAAGRERVWLVASHWRDDLAELLRIMEEEGLRPAAVAERPGARLQLWVRASG